MIELYFLFVLFPLMYGAFLGVLACLAPRGFHE